MSTLTIRRAELTDMPRLLEIYAYYVEHTAITFEYEVPTLEEFTSRFTQITKVYPYLVAESEGKIVGYAYANKFHPRKAYEWSSELTVYNDVNFQKHGAGKALYQALEDILKAMGITNLYACIAVPITDDEYLTSNSIDFHYHIGFTHAGTFRNCGYKFHRWYDMAWVEKIIGEHITSQPDITPFTELKNMHID